MKKKPRRKPRKTAVLNPIIPSGGLRRVYAKKLKDLVLEMTREVNESLKVIPVQTMDSAAKSFDEWVMTKAPEIRDKYRMRFEKKSGEMAKWFTVRANRSVRDQWQRNAEKFGLPTVSLSLTESQQAMLDEILRENIRLIKDVHESYFDGIDKDIRDSQLAGNDVHKLAKAISNTGKVTGNRAAFIARDQTIKATSFIARQREIDLGITHGIWMHSRAAKNPRKWHEWANGKKFNLSTGIFEETGEYLPDEKTGMPRQQFPGHEILCGCTHRPVIVIGGKEYD